MQFVYKFCFVQTSDNFSKLLDAFKQGGLPQKNGMLEILKFFSRKQQKDEPFEQFLADLQSLVKLCGFADQETKLLKAQIVIGIGSKTLQEQLLNEDFSLEKIILYCKSEEAVERLPCQSGRQENIETGEMRLGNQTEPELFEEQVDMVSKKLRSGLLNLIKKNTCV